MDHWTLISKHLAGTLTEQEQASLKAWIAASSANKKLFDEMNLIWQAGLPIPELKPNQSWKRVYALLLSQSKTQTRSPKTIPLMWTKYAVAASIALLIALAFVFWPGTPKAIMNLASTQADIKQVILPDSTQVWLNQYSELEYPEGFDRTFRSVSLRGEAYFQVYADKARPFIISAGQTQTRVLGTSFTLSAYPNRDSVSLNLDEGKVAFSAGTNRLELSAGQAVYYQTSTKTLSKPQNLVPDHQVWREQQLHFSLTPLSEVSKILSDLYQRPVRLASESLASCTFNGSFKQASLEEILDILAVTLEMEIVETPDYILIQGAPCN